MKTNQSYIYTGSISYTFDNIVLNDGKEVSFITSANDPEGINQTPYDGAIVTMSSGTVGLGGDIIDPDPDLNNKFYYLVTNTLYDESEKETVISLATEVPISLDGGKYSGSFVFLNPNDFKRLYMIYDYTNNMGSGSASHTGGLSTKIIDIDFSSDIGRTGVGYVITDTPARITLRWAGSVVGDTGFVGLNTLANYNALIAAGITDDEINLVFPYDGLVNNGTGSIEFQKTNATIDGQMTVHSPLASTAFSLTTSATSLKSYFFDPTRGDFTDVCGQCPDVLLYHNGNLTAPSQGDTIYSTSDGSTVFDGFNTLHLIDSVACVAPPVVDADWLAINNGGLVTAKGSCACSEIAIPVITMFTAKLSTLLSVSLSLEATNNPTSWAVISTCRDYALTGGETGTTFSYTNCDSETLEITVSASVTLIVAAESTPTRSVGNGTITDQGVSISSVLPEGMSFDTTNGTLNGTPRQGGDFAFVVTATNCFGTSIQETITLSVSTDFDLKPFNMNTGEPQADGETACTITPFSCELMHHNGSGVLPDLRDTIYNDPNGESLFTGGSEWYFIEGSTYSIKVDSLGSVIDKNIC